MTKSGPPKITSKKHRDCPALGRPITSAECGSQRGTKLDCPADCPHFPFGVAGLELWERVSAEWSIKAVALLVSKLGRDRVPPLMKEQALPVEQDELRVEAAIHQVMMTTLFIERDGSGKALGDGWEDQPLSGLNNDERLITRHRRQARVTVIEVQRVVDATSFLALDLLEPERAPFLVLDRTTTPRIVRFTRLFTWLMHFPKVSRLSLPAYGIPHAVYQDWLTRVQAEFGQAGSANPGLGFKEFLSLRMGRCVELINAVVGEQADALRARTDMNRCLAAYTLRAPATDIETLLAAKPEFRRQESAANDPAAEPHTAFAWLREGESAALEKQLEGVFHLNTSFDGKGTVGTVRVFAGRLLIETLAKTKHAFARQYLEQLLGDRIAFEQEAIEDLTQIAAERDRGEMTVGLAQQVFFPGYDEAASRTPVAKAAPEPTDAAEAERKAALRQEHERHYREFLDQPIDVLGGKTPREAAQDLAWRPKLIEVIKSHLYGIAVRNRDDGLDLEINSILDSLGLAELR
jgi:hypothetical protein